MGTKKSLNLTELFYKKSETRTRAEITSEIDSTIRSHEVIASKEEKANKVTSWGNPLSDVKYPSEKLVKTELNTKASTSDLESATTTLQGNINTVETNTNTAIGQINTALNSKVDKVTGKGLSTNDYTTAEKDKLANIEARANRTIVDNELNPNSTNPVQNAVICAEFYDKEDIVGLLNSIETGHGKLLSIYIDEDTGDLVVDDDGFDYYTAPEVDDGFTVNVEKQAQAESGYIATYVVKQGGTQKGVKINIPKDYLVKSASVETCSTANTPSQGLAVGDKYIDFVINTKDGTGSAEHLYLNLHDLTDVYTADESTLQLSNSNVFSIKSVPASLISGVLPANQVTHQDISGKVSTSDIADNLVTNNASKVLSAKQGKVLDENKLDVSQGSGNANKYLATDSNGDVTLVNQPAVPTKVSDLTNDSGFITSSHSHGNISSDGKVTTTATSSGVDKVVVTDSNGDLKVISTLPAANVTQASMTGKEDTSNKVTSWQSTPDDTHYPSEKLVKDSLNGKVDTAGTGLSKSGTTLGHSNSVSAESSAVFKKIAFDAQGHITSTANVEGSDLPSHTHSGYLTSSDIAGKMDSSDYDTVSLAVVFEDSTTATYDLVYEK